jgi:glycosyltransferase involved in cell wall biosynthesis
MKVLALEPWFGGSHRQFLEGLARHSEHEFRLATMAARSWKWRMQGGAVTLAHKAHEAVADGFRPDALFASDMVNLPAFLALTRDVFAETPVVLFFHENQLTYPIRPGTDRDYTYAYINYLSALAADHVVFNSQYHYDEFFDALPVLLRRFPDYTHLRTAQKLRDKSSVLHLGVDLEALDRNAPANAKLPGPPVVLWNQRWEHDKNPEAFFRLMNRLDDVASPFRLILAGERFEHQPPEFERAFERYADRIIHYGYADDLSEYAKLLHRADIVVSTSRHEFFGVAMLEAIYCGCHPLLPRRLTYPELVPERLHRPLLHAPILYDDEDELFETLRRILTGQDRTLPRSVLREISEPLAWPSQAPRYDALLAEVADGAMVATRA